MSKNNAYAVLRARQQEEYNKFPIGAAFNQEQFDKMMIQWGLYPSETDKIVSLGYGCFIQKKDVQAYHELGIRHAQELKEAFASDTTGTGFVYDAFYYELANHEYCITGDLSEAVTACGLDWETVMENPIYDKALRKAADDVLRDSF